MNKISFVYVYWHDASQSDELRWSIRSIEKHFMGLEPEIVIAGDRPPWYQGKCLDIEHQGNWLQDAIRKLQIASESDQVTDRFVWMMDDIYFLRDFVIQDLEIPRANGRYTNMHGRARNTPWRKARHRTLQAIIDRNGEAWDYATHLPHVVHKHQLAEMFATWDLLSGRYLWEIIYGGLYYGKPLPANRALCYTHENAKSQDHLERIIGRRWVLNNGTRAWGKVLRDYLHLNFPSQSALELQGVPAYVAYQEPVTEFTGMSEREIMLAKMREGKDIHRELVLPRTAETFQCEYMGEPIRTVDGRTCGSRGRKTTVFECRLKGECTRRCTGHTDVAACNRCHVFHAWLEIR